ncbi:MAG: cytidine deaminase [Acidimicrobiales bacterium]
MTGTTPIPWDRLRTEARAVADRAYSPYSGFRVGAAALVDDGRIVTGCNVENISHGLTLCAECGLVSDLMATGGGRLVAVVVVSGSGAPCTPCGRCRQLLHEHGGDDLLVDGDGTVRRLEELLPGSFSAARLAQG